MTKTKLSFAAALLAVGLILSLSVYGLPGGEEAAEPQDPQDSVVEIDVEEIQRSVERALEAVPWEEIHQQLGDVQGILDGVDVAAIHAQVESAMADIDVAAIHAEVEAAMADIDVDAIRAEVETAMADIDMDAIMAEVETAMAEVDVDAIRAEALEDIDWDEIRLVIEEAKGVTAEELDALEEMLEELSGNSGVI